jgi:hypothetical protein
MDGDIDENVCRKCRSEVSIGERMYRNVLMCYGHVEMIVEERIVKRLYHAKVDGVGQAEVRK